MEIEKSDFRIHRSQGISLAPGSRCYWSFLLAKEDQNTLCDYTSKAKTNGSEAVLWTTMYML